uniref:Uncharacterized protein n=1 Tax=Thermococcus sp. AMT11 TaxID=563043 RepID=C8BNB9_9EURY|nr:unknown [Thermococcus sp. AMT11]
MDVNWRRTLGLVVILFLLSVAGAASAATLDLPKWVIVPEDGTFSDVTLFCGLDAMDLTNNVTPCYYQGALVNATIYFNSTMGYPKLVTGKILNAFEFDGSVGEGIKIVGLDIPVSQFSVYLHINIKKAVSGRKIIILRRTDGKWTFGMYTLATGFGIIIDAGSKQFIINAQVPGEHDIAIVQTGTQMLVYLDDKEYTFDSVFTSQTVTTVELGRDLGTSEGSIVGVIDEVRIYDSAISKDQYELLRHAGRKSSPSPPASARFSARPLDLTRDRATFYAGLEVSTTDPSGYVPVPESAVNMSITSAPKLVSDYTGAPFYYQGHYWYRADKIQFNLPIQFETVRQSGTFDDVIILDEDEKQIVFEKEFKVTNPTGARINVLYAVDPTALGFSPLQFPSFELDGVAMASWNPDNSTRVYAIRTDVLDPGEISTHWIKATWTIKKEEVSFPAKLDDFRSINSFEEAQKLFENAAKGKGSTYVSVISITSNADVSNVTIYVPLQDVEDPEDVIEAVALTGTRETLEVKQLEDGRVVVRVPGDAFVAGNAEVKVLYSKELSFWDRIKQLIASIKAKIASILGWGG